MKRRYRSLKKARRINLAPGLIIEFHNHFYPQVGKPPCEDPTIIRLIEAKPGFGRVIWRADAPEDISISKDAVPEGTSEAAITGAARALTAMGMKVNPKLLEGEGEEAEPKSQMVPPTKTFISQAKKAELQETIKKYGWDDIDPEWTVNQIREAMRAKVDAYDN